MFESDLCLHQQAAEPADTVGAESNVDAPEPWQPDGWGTDGPGRPPRWEEDDLEPDPAIEIAEY